MRVGIDKVHLTTQDFMVHDQYELDGVPPMRVKGIDTEPIGFDGSGEAIYGKLIDNSDFGQLTINSKGLHINTNPSKHLHPYHLLTEPKAAKGQFQALQKHIDSLKIGVNVEAMRICRLDPSKQTEMSQPVSVYSDALRVLRGKNRARATNYLSGHRFENKSRGATFYDKGLEVFTKQDIQIPETNLLRAETFMKKSRTVSLNTMGINYLPDLYAASQEQLDTAYHKVMKGVVFPEQQGEQQVMNFTQNVNILKAMKQETPRAAWSRFVNIHGITSLVEQCGGMAGLDVLLEAAGYTRQSRYRMKREAEAMILKKGFIDSSKNMVSTASLLQEIQDKFLAA